MKRTTCAVITTILVMDVAHAYGPEPEQEQHQRQYQGQDQEQYQRQYQGQEVVLEVSPVINIDQPELYVTTEIEGDTTLIEGDRMELSIVENNPSELRIKNTPALGNTYIVPTSSCMSTAGGSASGPGAGISLGFSRKDKECDKRELARMFFDMGERSFGLKILCTSESIPEDLIGICPLESTITEISERINAVFEEEVRK